MPTKSTITPTTHHRIMDLLSLADFDTSDWPSYNNGKSPAAANPKYCYNWSFIDPGVKVLLCLWIDSIEETNGEIFWMGNIRRVGTELKLSGSKNHKGADSADKMDQAIQHAWLKGLPVRVVVCEMKIMQNEYDTRSVDKRLLDPLPWAVTAYDLKTGDCEVTRGAVPNRFVDQHSIVRSDLSSSPKKTVTTDVFNRSSKIRQRVLMRADGKCELCGTKGFEISGGKVYLETHHIVPLCEGGEDTEANVVALCPNEHRYAHFGNERHVMKERLLAVVRGKRSR